MQFLHKTEVPDSLAWETLARAMAVEPSIMASRATAANLERVYRAGRAVLAWEDGPVGFIAAWEMDGDVEIGAAWVHPARRGGGLGNRLVEEIVALATGGGERAFAITTNPRFVAAALHGGMYPHDDWRSPIPWSTTCGACDAIAEHEKDACPKRNASCRLLLCPGS